MSPETQRWVQSLPLLVVAAGLAAVGGFAAWKAMATLTITTTAGPVAVEMPDEAMARVLAIMPGDTDTERAQALGAELVAHCQRQATDAVVRAAHEVAEAFLAAVREQAAG